MEIEESWREVSTEGNGAGPVSELGGGGVSVFWRGEAL